ncbi:hypothetical protein [Paenibacillus sinensis]|uniref:hypothetical protein n=1 Tax=Paenibacillus sinensis TaxID=2834413 RepID=UPI001CA9474F|nr:hypothetical protein [Paenibacillus sinensis]
MASAMLHSIRVVVPSELVWGYALIPDIDVLHIQKVDWTSMDPNPNGCIIDLADLEGNAALILMHALPHFVPISIRPRNQVIKSY